MPNPTPRQLTHNGQTLTLQQWAKKTGISAETIRSRLDHQGWNVARALTEHSAKKYAKRTSGKEIAPRPVPTMLHHKASGRAYAKWHADGTEQVRYFGPWQSAEARGEYQRFCVEWNASMGAVAPRKKNIGVRVLAAGYLDHCRAYYVKDGKQTSEVHSQTVAIRVLVELYRTLPVEEFKPKHLKACQQAMIEKGWARESINKHTWRITRCFSWGVAEEMVPVTVADALAHVPNLQAGRTAAHDPDPVMTVPAEVIEATLPHLDPVPARCKVLEAMIRFQLLVGCRPGELCAMTTDAVEQQGDVWVYRVVDKNTHRQTKRKPRLVWIGPRAQEILRPFLASPGPGGRIWCFPPRWTKSEKSKPTPISTNRYAEVVRYACEAAKVESWTPHQLRHNRATEVQRTYESDEAAAAAIGDTPEVTRAVYADPNEAVARRIARATG